MRLFRRAAPKPSKPEPKLDRGASLDPPGEIWRVLYRLRDRLGNQAVLDSYTYETYETSPKAIFRSIRSERMYGSGTIEREILAVQQLVAGIPGWRRYRLDVERMQLVAVPDLGGDDSDVRLGFCGICDGARAVRLIIKESGRSHLDLVCPACEKFEDENL